MTLLTVTPYERRDRQTVLDLLYGSFQTHLHLDWYSAEYWLETMPLLRLAWKGSRLAGVMGASEPMFGTTWLRMIVVRDYLPTRVVLIALWDSLKRELRTQGLESAWLLIANDWLADFASVIGFRRRELVVTLHRRGDLLPVPRLTPFPITLRPAELEDVATMTRVDQAAFAPPWQLTHSDLWQATRQAAICTTAWDRDTMIGYQLSTRHREAGHLARLAVLPQTQGQGVGGALVHQMLATFLNRGVQTVTVNTQRSNEQSQRVYRAYGFERNGYDMPVWMQYLDDADHDADFEYDY